MNAAPHLKKYLFRERLIRAILKEWKVKKNLSLPAICNQHDIPYFKSRTFLTRLAKDGIITWRKGERGLKKTPSDFWLNPNAEKRLQEELLYASSE